MVICQSYTLRRSGTVQWSVDHHSRHHCGAKEHLRKTKRGVFIPVRFNIELTCYNSLDVKGFLFDQLGLVEFMDRQAKERTDLSCELLAMQTGNRLIKELRDQSPTCLVKELTLSLSPFPHQASLTTHWHK